MLGRTVRILSVDGGGVRGIIPALILEELERRLTRRGKVPVFSRLFDLMVGTSTGGLIVLGLSCPGERAGRRILPRYRPEDLTRFYRDRGADIFPFRRFNALRTMSQAFTDKYDYRGYEELLRETFGESTLRDSLCPLLVTSYDINRGLPHLFKHRPGGRYWEDLNFSMAQAARATSAAPTFFEPAVVESLGPEVRRFYLVDGSMVANNPALIAYSEARKLYPGALRYVILSLGTGLLPRRFSYPDIRRWGYLDWVSPSKDVPLLSEYSQGQSAAVEHMLNRMPRVSFHRLNVPLHQGSDMDDARPESLDLLSQATEEFLQISEPLLDAAVRDLW